ncbi:MAG: dihydropteroate synthase [Rikenellaceae bacterium]|nr:dihydropteroate synthase [Rikenellaceae bacterium]
MGDFTLSVGGQNLDLTSPAVMAIINVTPDSFWEGSRLAPGGREAIRTAVGRAVADGAAILDVGGYSSRPGAEDITPQQEYERVARALDVIRAEYPGTVVSLDTFRAEVAVRIVERYGPCIVNDISAGELDPEMIPAVASLGVPYIAMHMRGTPADMQDRTGYRDIAGEVAAYLARKAETLTRAGVRQPILDPGFGFAKTTAQNYSLLHSLDRICALGYPVLSGVSRKSMIYKVLDTTPADSLPGTCALNWESLRKGASILRVHDVREASEIVKLYSYYTQNQ